MSTAALETGRDALRRGAWEEARECFENVLRENESPKAWEGLGSALSYLDDPGTIDARERAYRGYLERGAAEDAARVACWLMIDYAEFRGEQAIARGWLRRAERHLADIPLSYTHGLLRCLQGYDRLLSRKQPESALRLVTEAADVARSVGAPDLEMFALAIEGLTFVSRGEVDRGMRLLDEATAAATAGESDEVVIVATTCCLMIAACERVRDFDRAMQWCGRVENFCRRWRLRSFFSICRTQHAMLLLYNGRWEEAEAALLHARNELHETRPALAQACTVRLGELRRRQGRWDEAEELFADVRTHVLSLLGMGALCLDRGDHATAVDYARRHLRRFSEENCAEQVPGLELLLRAELALGDSHSALDALSELCEIHADIDTPSLQAAVRNAEGLVAEAEGDLASAQVYLEDAADLYRDVDLPFEAGRALICLGKVLCDMDRPARADAELSEAIELLGGLGAAREVERAQALRREIRRRLPKTEPIADSVLTEREQEVLSLIAAGLVNSEIADRLFLSVRTVERHISNIYGKLGVSGRAGRAAATAYAIEQGLRDA